MRGRTQFFGRHETLAHVAARLDEGCRLVTIRGTAGIGKTRLARQLAADWERDGRGREFFCELETASSAHDVLAVVGGRLGVPLTSTADVGLTGEQIGVAISGNTDALLVLDNVEHLLDVIRPLVDRWMDVAPGARFVATSRERLSIDGETIVELPPLSEDEAFALFEDRARAVRADFEASPEDPVISALLRELEGIPLAIELAAARVRGLGPSELLSRMHDRLDLLGDTRPGVAARHTTLRAAIASSWALLDGAERAALARCSVFRGSWSLDAACAILGDGEGDATRVVDVVTSLCDRSLVQTVRPEAFPEELRYHLYESVREYASEQLAALGDRDAAEQRHTTWFVEAGERLAAAARSSGGGTALARLELDADNLLEVHRRSLGRAAGDAARGALALEPLLDSRGPASRALTLLESAASAMVADSDRRLRIRLSRALASVRRVTGQLEEARRDIDTAIAGAMAISDAKLEAEARATSGRLEIDRGSLDAALAELHASLALGRALGQADDPHTLRFIGWANVLAGRLDEASGWLERALDGYAAAGMVAGQGHTHVNLGSLAARRRSWAETEHHLRRALALARDARDGVLEVVAESNLGDTLRDTGRFDEARRSYDNASTNALRLGRKPVEAMTATALGLLEHGAGELVAARSRWLRALETHRVTHNVRFAALTRAHLGILELEAGATDAAKEHLRAAIRVDGTKEPFLEGLVLAYVGVLSFTIGDSVTGAAELAEARRHCEHSKALTMVAILRILEGFVDLSSATRALERRDAVAAAAALAGARARLEPAAPSDVRSADEVIAVRILASAIERVTSRPVEPEPANDVRVLELGPDARWFRVAGADRVSLARHSALRLLLRCLVEGRVDRPGEPVAMPDLVAAGWPGERITKAAGAKRMYTAMSTLRRMGLRDVLVRREQGYLLDPAARLVRT